ncbi:hypothetical protein [Paraburkholderia sp. RL17-337-BIB-A]|uniref:hypothetical protein n=1 Tax=Paraburkholderia sp. RL17-337-BIB-A TaxID=3031636 RepID=UPI0038BB9154
MPNQQLIDDYVDNLVQAEGWFDDVDNDKTYGGVSTFQGVETGFTGEPNGPQAVHKGWAYRELKKLSEEGFDVNALDSTEGFERWHAKLIDSYEANYERKGLKPLPRHTVYRLVDLFVKWLRVYRKEYPAVVAAIKRHAHVVLNEPNRNLISEIIDDCPPYGSSTQSTEGAVRSYNDIQNKVRVFCQQRGGSPIIVDVWARNRNHSGE